MNYQAENRLRVTNSDVMREIIEAQLPSQYGSLLLTFYVTDTQRRDNLIIFGDDYGTNLCVDLSDSFVYSVDSKNELPKRFVNTNVKCLAECLDAHQRCVTELARTNTEEQQLQVIKQLSEQINIIDSRALLERENWWAVVLEQMQDG